MVEAGDNVDASTPAPPFARASPTLQHVRHVKLYNTSNFTTRPTLQQVSGFNTSNLATRPTLEYVQLYNMSIFTARLSLQPVQLYNPSNFTTVQLYNTSNRSTRPTLRHALPRQKVASYRFRAPCFTTHSADLPPCSCRRCAARWRYVLAIRQIPSSTFSAKGKLKCFYGDPRLPRTERVVVARGSQGDCERVAAPPKLRMFWPPSRTCNQPTFRGHSIN